jgi:hypothetical protein
MDGTVACFFCGEEVRRGARLCPACGENPAQGAASAQEKYDAGRELHEAIRFLGSLRLYFGLGAGFSALMAGIAVMVGAGPGPVAMLGLVAAVAAAAAWDVYRRPVPWSLALALLQSANLGLAAWGFAGGRTGIVSVVVAFLLTAAFWHGFASARKLKDTLRRFPDLYASRKLLGGRTAPEGTASRKLRGRGRTEDRIARRRILLFAGAAVAAAGLVGVGVWSWMHPGPEAALDGMRADWNAGSWGAVAARFDPVSRERMEKGMRALLRKRGWDSRPPALGVPVRMARDRERVVAYYEVPGGELRVDWELRNRTWVITGMKFPEQ